jgi:hypothetical protein
VVCFLQWILGYHFSVAVWVGYIALFGTAIQTGIVMVTYLGDALEKRAQRGSAFTREDLLEAVKEGAFLRLRPKVMTVSTVVAKPLAGDVEHADRRGSDETPRCSSDRRDDLQPPSHPHRHAGSFCVDSLLKAQTNINRMNPLPCRKVLSAILEFCKFCQKSLCDASAQHDGFWIA